MLLNISVGILYLIVQQEKEDVREAPITKHNLLLYRVTDNTIYLLYFWDTRKDPERKHL